MRTVRNSVLVLFVLVAASTSQLVGSEPVNLFVQAYNCDTPTYYSTGSCVNGGVILYCQPGMYYGFFCEDAEYMCNAHCNQYGEQGNLDGCYATDLLGAVNCQCQGICSR